MDRDEALKLLKGGKDGVSLGSVLKPFLSFASHES